jgi:hypothetical protein
MMIRSFSADHRIVDGAIAPRCLQQVKQLLEMSLRCLNFTRKSRDQDRGPFFLKAPMCADGLLFFAP